MEKFVKNFIGMSIVYLGIAAVIGIAMFLTPTIYTLKFVHSHLMMLGWVSMMIFGVGYHVLPRFAGKVIKSVKLGEVQFWIANVGLIGMMVFYVLMQFEPENSLYKALTVLFGMFEVASAVIFFYNMLATLFSKDPEAA